MSKSKKKPAHRCNDPRCSGFDRERLYKRIKQHGFQLIEVLDEQPPTVYSVGLFANLGIPELVVWGEEGQGLPEMMAVAVEHLKERRSIEPGEHIEIANVPFYLWPGEHVHQRSVRAAMGQARDYYREIHMKRFEDVPVWLISPNPYDEHRHSVADWPSDGKERLAITCKRVAERVERVAFVHHENDGQWIFLCSAAHDNHNADEHLTGIHPEHLVESDLSLEPLRDLPAGHVAFRERPDAPWDRMLESEFFEADEA